MTHGTTFFGHDISTNIAIFQFLGQILVKYPP